MLSARLARWMTARAPYQREIMDALCDPRVETVVIMSSAQIGKTEIINNTVGYHIHLDPAPILLLLGERALRPEINARSEEADKGVPAKAGS